MFSKEACAAKSEAVKVAKAVLAEAKKERSEIPQDLPPGLYRLKVSKVLLAAMRSLADGTIVFRVEGKQQER